MRRIVVRVLEGVTDELEPRRPGEARFELGVGDHVEVRTLATEFEPAKVRIVVGVVNQHMSIGWSQKLV